MLRGLGIECGVDLAAGRRHQRLDGGPPGPTQPVGRRTGAGVATARLRQNRRMADVVYLHVGAPKTGTTYIQDRLALNRAHLARHDVRYPIGAARRHVPRGPRPDRAAVGRDARRRRRASGTRWSSGPGAARARSSSATRSSPAPPSEQVERAIASLAPAEIHVVLTARDIARQVPAEWQERLKHQGRMRLRQVRPPGR